MFQWFPPFSPPLPPLFLVSLRIFSMFFILGEIKIWLLAAVSLIILAAHDKNTNASNIRYVIFLYVNTYVYCNNNNKLLNILAAISFLEGSQEKRYKIAIITVC